MVTWEISRFSLIECMPKELARDLIMKRNDNSVDLLTKMKIIDVVYIYHVIIIINFSSISPVLSHRCIDIIIIIIIDYSAVYTYLP